MTSLATTKLTNLRQELAMCDDAIHAWKLSNIEEGLICPLDARAKHLKFEINNLQKLVDAANEAEARNNFGLETR